MAILDRFGLAGKVALVTGAGQGIGRGYAHALGEAGAAVAVVDILEKHAREVAEELSAKGIDALALTADVTQKADVQRAVTAVVKKWGKLTIGVNNAGIGQWVDAMDITEEIWQKVMRLNLDAVLYCSQTEAAEMRKARYGKIVNTASMSGHIVNTPQNQTPYNVSKAGVLHPDGARGNTGVHPGRQKDDGNVDAAHPDASHGLAPALTQQSSTAAVYDEVGACHIVGGLAC
jgi:NAD(P)-dependent dehydrogenase (short-subunit alcohol dehydrogenase family)